MDLSRMIKIRVHLALIAVLTVSLSAGFRESVCALQVLYDEISPKFDKNGLFLKEQKIVAAEADARRIDIRQAALSKNPTIIQWEFVQKMSPNIQWGILPDNIVPVINFKGLTGPEK